METNTRSENVNEYLAHPDFSRWAGTWKKHNDCIDGGADTVKDASRKYLPATSGQLAQWNTPIPGAVVEDLGEGRTVCGISTTAGAYSYELYKFRAIYYEYPSETVRISTGRLTYEPPSIDLPSQLEPMIDAATSDGRSIERLIEDIYKEQLSYSRCGVLADFTGEDVAQAPYLCVYDALRVLNWKTTKTSQGKEIINFVILDESGYETDGIRWSYVKKIRVCALDKDGNYFTELHDTTDLSKEDMAGIDFLDPSSDAVYPKFVGKFAREIPFVFINANSIASTPELPILSSLVNMSLAIYRGEADYRQALFMQGQATPVFAGSDETEVSKYLLGAQGTVYSQNPDFKATFMEVSGAGLAEMRTSQENMHKLAISEGMKLVESGANESGEALKERTDSQTVSLKGIASACEAGLNKIVTILMDWGGISGEAEIKLNREFGEGAVSPSELKTMQESYLLGAPILQSDVHKYAQEGGLTDSTLEEVENEMKLSGRSE